MADPLGSGSAYFVPPDTVFAGPATNVQSLVTVGSRARHLGMQLRSFPFTVLDAQVWNSGIPNIQAVAWQPENADLPVGVTLYQQGGDALGGIVYFGGGFAGSRSGWLWVLSGSSG